MIGGWNIGSGGGGKSFIITFNTTPTNATIIVRDEKGTTIAPTTNKTYKLKAGLYTYDAAAEGYFTKTEQKLPVLEDGEVIVTLEKELYVTFNLTPENAAITLKDNDGKNVDPEIDTPNKFKVKKGAYKYSASADRYFPVTDIVFSMEDTDKTIDVKLDKKLYATFILNPTDATLVVKDGSGTVQTAQDDHTYELKAGMYSYSCSKEGFKSVENVSFEMTEDEEEKTINVSLQDASIYGVRRSLTISSTAWERIENGIGKTAKAQTSTSTVQNDFDNIKPWSDIKICDVLKDGTVSSYEGDPTFSATNPKRLYNGRSARVLVEKRTG